MWHLDYRKIKALETSFISAFPIVKSWLKYIRLAWLKAEPSPQKSAFLLTCQQSPGEPHFPPFFLSNSPNSTLFSNVGKKKIDWSSISQYNQPSIAATILNLCIKKMHRIHVSKEYKLNYSFLTRGLK